MRINFVDDISVLSKEQKKVFYILFSNNLTTSIRCVFSEKKLSESDKIECVKSINEISHRLLNRLFDLELNHNTWCEADVWGMIKNIVRLNKNIQSHVGNAISRAIKAIGSDSIDSGIEIKGSE
jgi:hypothetical protein